MPISRIRLLLISLSLTALLALLVWGAKSLLEPFGPLRVTVVNDSGKDIVSIETGMVSTGLKQIDDEPIKAGQRSKIRPEFRWSGEGAVYQRYVFADGEEAEAIVCGYTESLSGKSTVTLLERKVEVEQSCY
ncbi:hypothetical protein [Cohnella boryungensis]|uniref:Uncharacterized protein n=1 Tax=Cohnella boryungensis TaxID=768479 RepID=A0ABV8S5C2_9BACL